MKPTATFEPRGLEAAVPALALLRQEWWASLSRKAKAFLELADYIGVRGALDLTHERFNELFEVIPRDLWLRCSIEIADCAAERGAFQGPTGAALTMGDVLAWFVVRDEADSRDKGNSLDL